MNLSTFVASRRWWGTTEHLLSHEWHRVLVPMLLRPRPWLEASMHALADECGLSAGPFTVLATRVSPTQSPSRHVQPQAARRRTAFAELMFDGMRTRRPPLRPPRDLLVVSAEPELLEQFESWARTVRVPLRTCALPLPRLRPVRAPVPPLGRGALGPPAADGLNLTAHVHARDSLDERESLSVRAALLIALASTADVHVSDSLPRALWAAALLPGHGQLLAREVHGRLVVVFRCAGIGRPTVSGRSASARGASSSAACPLWRNDSFDPIAWHHPEGAACRRALLRTPRVLELLDGMIAAERAQPQQREPLPSLFHHVWFAWRAGYSNAMHGTAAARRPELRQLPNMSAAFRASCARLHPRFTFRLWANDDARDFLEEHYAWFLPYYDAFDQPIKRADAVRYFLLFHFGGVCACLRRSKPGRAG